VAVGFGPDVVTFTDPDTNRLVVVVEVSGTVRLDVDTLGQILGYADTGVVINQGRTVALLTYGLMISPSAR
jgi:hypothetical protein